MDEMYRMLGREHEADLAREACKRRHAREAGRSPDDSAVASTPGGRRRPGRLAGNRIGALLARLAREQA
jgi:hypothetical protein